MKAPNNQLVVKVYKMLGATPAPTTDTFLQSDLAVPDSQGEASFDVSPVILGAGTHKIYTTWTDILGNEGPPSAVRTFSVNV